MTDVVVLAVLIGFFEVQKLIGHHTDDRFLGLLGESGVNVLELNVALDELAN